MKLTEKYNVVYFVGIGGIGMSALARYFKASNVRVLGYDKTSTVLTGKLEEEGMEITFEDEISAAIQALDKESTLVIYTPAIKSLQILDYFEKSGFEVIKRAKALGLLTKATESLAIAGTHGKTTTSTLVAHLCKEADLPFSCFLGGISENFKSNFYYNGDQISVVEADEFDRSFLSLSPDWAIITSNDADHLDIYGDRKAMEQGFCEFAKLLANDKQLFVRKGVEIDRDCLRYAVNEKADFYSDDLRIKEGLMHFDFHHKEQSWSFSWSIPGTHNVENATAAIALLSSMGVDMEVLQRGLLSFKGIKRRYTLTHFASGKHYIDDYAHHPTELNAVLSSIRTFYPDKKLLVVFQPHLYSRTRDFEFEFAKSLENSDSLIVLDIYPAREKAEDFPGVSSKTLLDKIPHLDKQNCSLEEALEIIKTKEFDILVTVGAGNIDRLFDPITKWMALENPANT